MPERSSTLPGGPTPPPIVRRRLATPPPSRSHTSRPRLTALLDRLTANATVVRVTATAGAGKTAAVAEWAVAQRERPVAWLTCDDADVATGRLLTYVLAAVEGAVPATTATARAAMETGVPHGEVAGLLAEAVAETGLVLVFDETERWRDDAAVWSLVSSFVRYADARTCVVLVGRREPPPEHLVVPVPRLRAVGDVQLALTADEARHALAAHGADDVDPELAIELTGGWVTGVLFEAWTADDHVEGTGGEADPLNGYLSSHILAQLPAADREFLVTTAVLDHVSADRARRLGIDDAGERLRALRTARLPCSWTKDGTELRCHTRFREYLVQLLDRRGPAAARAVRRRHADLLVEEGHDEEAVELLLAIEAPEAALVPAERCVLRVLERGDVEVASRWLAAVADAAPFDAGALTLAQLMLAIAEEDFAGAARIVDRLDASEVLRAFTAARPEATALVAWTYLHAARLADYARLMEQTEDPAVRDAMRFAAQVVADQPGPLIEPPRTGTVSDAFILVGQYCLGRVTELAAEPLRGWTDVVASPWVLAAIRDTGQTQRALELYEAAMAQAPSKVLDVYVGPELLLDAGQPERARACADAGVASAQASGSLGLLGLSLLSQVRLALRVDHDPDGAERLLDLMEDRGVRAFAFIAEAMDAWRGLARLQAGDAAAARSLLERAVASMGGGRRLLELPAAAVWLAEAAWRCDDEDAADAATDAALAAADGQGSLHLLAQALREFPAVLARRLDAEADADSRWFEVARAVRSGTVGPEVRPGVRLHVRELGERTFEVDGEARHTGIAKAHEVLAALVADGRRVVPRSDLMAVVFDGRSDRSSRTYMRQALSRLKQTLPEGILEITEDAVVVAEGVRLSSDSGELVRGLSEAATLGDEDRLAALRPLFARWERGPYLAGVRAEWAEQRERGLLAAITDGYDDAAGLALARGDYRASAGFARAALDGDPYRETAWRTLMRLHHALGDEPGVISVYNQCRERFAALGTTPSSSTQRLLTDLRR